MVVVICCGCVIGWVGVADCGKVDGGCVVVGVRACVGPWAGTCVVGSVVSSFSLIVPSKQCIV